MEELEAEIQSCQEQLTHIDELLGAAPTDSGLLDAKHNLTACLALLQEALVAQLEAAAAAPTNYPGSVTTNNESSRHVPHDQAVPTNFVVGSDCRVRCMRKGAYRAAVILELRPDSGTCLVKWKHPRSRAEALCSFFVQGKCRWSDGECSYSHGIETDLRAVKEEEEAGGEKTKKRFQPGDLVLAEYHQDKLWYKAVVDHYLPKHRTYLVTFSDYNSTEEVSPEQLVPYDTLYGDFEDEPETEDSSSDDEDDGSEEEEDFDPDFGVAIVAIDDSGARASRETDGTSDSYGSAMGYFDDGYIIGEWEKHTKGFASKMMARMGYKRGMGLGKHGEGRARAVEVQVIPAGRSLDHLSDDEGKEGGKGDGHRKRKRGSKKKKGSRKPKRKPGDGKGERTNVFDFLNRNISSAGSDQTAPSATSSTKRKAKSQQELQKDLYHMKERQNELSQLLGRLEESLKRNEKRDATYAEQVRQKIGQVKQELKRVEATEVKLKGQIGSLSEKKSMKRSFF